MVGIGADATSWLVPEPRVDALALSQPILGDVILRYAGAGSQDPTSWRRYRFLYDAGLMRTWGFHDGRFLIARNDFLEREPEAVVRVLSGYLKILEDFESHKSKYDDKRKYKRGWVPEPQTSVSAGLPLPAKGAYLRQAYRLFNIFVSPLGTKLLPNTCRCDGQNCSMLTAEDVLRPRRDVECRADVATGLQAEGELKFAEQTMREDYMFVKSLEDAMEKIREASVLLVRNLRYLHDAKLIKVREGGWTSVEGWMVTASSTDQRNDAVPGKTTAGFSAENLKAESGCWREGRNSNSSEVNAPRQRSAWLRFHRSSGARARVDGFRVKVPDGVHSSGFRSYEFQCSDDATAWEVVMEGLGANQRCCSFEEYRFPPRTAKYWRLLMFDDWGYGRLMLSYIELHIDPGSWHLAPAGLRNCDHGVVADLSQCEREVAALAKLSSKTAGRAMRTCEVGSCLKSACGDGLDGLAATYATDWGDVPIGCSAQAHVADASITYILSHHSTALM